MASSEAMGDFIAFYWRNILRSIGKCLNLLRFMPDWLKASGFRRRETRQTVKPKDYKSNKCTQL